ncbi:MAG: 1-deoxy-D-xylulose-5-phosphate reductoisomerase [Burkholderiales bacterium]|nr:1-deoxy-D-xylulose-5-phosphate reductoisomerase [Burkholderiales bacterium]
MQNIVIFGSTGSIGKSTLDVLKLHKDRYSVFAITGYSNVQLLLQQCIEFMPKYVLIEKNELAKELSTQLKQQNLSTIVLNQKEDFIFLASHVDVDITMSAIVGAAGLVPTYHAALNGKRILLANKESLVAGGAIITQAVKDNNATLIPVDSEHSAIFQSLPFNYTSLDDIGVNKIILTASGGPFINTPYEQLCYVTAKEAVKHPNWSMGQKISVDSSTLMNKGLELIEAYWLFNAKIEQLEVVIHPQSIIHSMVEYIDSSIIAQLGTPDMKTPIAYALSAPDRIISGSNKLNFEHLKALTFETPDLKRFPCLELAWAGLKIGHSACAVINAANEIAVDLFLKDLHGFYDIPRMIEKAMNKYSSISANNIDEVVSLDSEVRDFCKSL